MTIIVDLDVKHQTKQKIPSLGVSFFGQGEEKLEVFYSLLIFQHKLSFSYSRRLPYYLNSIGRVFSEWKCLNILVAKQ